MEEYALGTFLFRRHFSRLDEFMCSFCDKAIKNMDHLFMHGSIVWNL